MTSTKSKDIWKITNDILNNTKQMDEWIKHKWPISQSLLHGKNKKKKIILKLCNHIVVVAVVVAMVIVL